MSFASFSLLEMATACPKAFDSSIRPAIAGEHPDHTVNADRHYTNTFPKFDGPVTFIEDFRGRKVEIGPMPDLPESKEAEQQP